MDGNTEKPVITDIKVYALILTTGETLEIKEDYGEYWIYIKDGKVLARYQNNTLETIK